MNIIKKIYPKTYQKINKSQKIIKILFKINLMVIYYKWLNKKLKKINYKLKKIVSNLI